LLPGIGYGADLSGLPDRDLLRRAAELSTELLRINGELKTQLRLSRETSGILQEALTEASSGLSGLKNELEVQWKLSAASQTELNTVSALLKQAEEGLKNLTVLYESSLSETALQTARANREERAKKIWRIIAVIAGAAAAGGIAAAAVF
jgi:hypothetical protein